MSKVVKTPVTSITTATPVDPTSANQPHLDLESTVDDLIAAVNGNSHFEYDQVTSSGLNFVYLGGNVIVENVSTAIVGGTKALTASNTNYVQIDGSNSTVISNTSGFIVGNIPLWEVTTDGSSITVVVDRRSGLNLQRKFDVISGDTGTDISADNPSDTLNIVGGNGVTVDTDDTTDTITVNATTGSLTGSIITWMLDTAPSGHLECDGSARSRVTYATLFALIGTKYGVGDGSTTFNIPNLQGYFLRGWDHGAWVDPDRASRTDRGDGTTGDNVGTKQQDELESHTHNTNIKVGGGGGSREADGQSGGGAGATTTATGGSETRPKNINVMYCIKT